MGQVFGATSQNGDRARAGTRPVSDYGPGARRGQPGEVPGLPDQRGRRAESVHNLLTVDGIGRTTPVERSDAIQFRVRIRGRRAEFLARFGFHLAD